MAEAHDRLRPLPSARAYPKIADEVNKPDLADLKRPEEPLKPTP